MRVNACILTRRIWRRASADSLIAVQSRFRSYPVVTCNENRSNLSTMTPTIIIRFDLTWTFIKDCCTCKLWSRGVDRPINHRDRDTFARVAFSSRLVEVVVGKVGLIGCSNGVCGMCRSNGNSNESQGESGRRGNSERDAHGLVLSGHHWRGSHPSSSRFAGARSLSDP